MSEPRPALSQRTAASVGGDLSKVPNLAYFVLFAPMALVLILRPQGLLGRAG